MALLVNHVVRPGHEEAFDALVAEVVAAIRREEPGTLVYVSHTDPDAPRHRVFYELYRDRAAFEEHERGAHVRHFLTEREQHVEAVEVLRLDAGEGTVSGGPLAG